MTSKQARTIINVLTKCEEEKWYKTNDDAELIETLKLCHDIYGIIRFTEDYKSFTRQKSFEQWVSEELEHPDGINIKFEFRKMEDVVFDYSHLKENKLPLMDHKEWNKKVGRAI